MYGIPLKFIGIGVAVIAVLAGLWGYGHHQFGKGELAERARWTPQLIAAQKALAEANAKTAILETAQDAATKAAEARYADQIQTLNQRAVGADQRIAGLLRKLAAASAGSGQLPAVSGSPGVPDAAAPSDERIDGLAGRLTGIGASCERDAAALGALQDWVREQQALAAVH